MTDLLRDLARKNSEYLSNLSDDVLREMESFQQEVATSEKYANARALIANARANIDPEDDFNFDAEFGDDVESKNKDDWENGAIFSTTESKFSDIEIHAA